MKTTAISSQESFKWPDVLAQLVAGEDLTVEQARWSMDEMMSGNSTDAQNAGLLIALASKGETPAELLGMADAMLDNAVHIDVDVEALDIVGTGGDRLNTVNLSTMSSLVVSGCGVPIVKHGNRGSSSSAGAADVIEALGVDLTMPQEQALDCLHEAGISFLFAQEYHPSMRYVAPARKQLGIPTAFNYLGPLSNPANVAAHALGCATLEKAPILADVIAARQRRGMVFRGDDGRDKITTSGNSKIWEVREGKVEKYDLDPRDFGIELQTVEALPGKDGAYNATLVHKLLEGGPGPIRDAVLLNAAAGLTAFEKDHEGHLFDRIRKNMDRAAESIDSGAARKVLDKWISVASR